MKTVQLELGLFQYKITDATKSSSIPHYIHRDQVDFLKRNFTWNKELGYYVGTLQEDSILKRLVCILKPSPPNTIREITLQNIDSALDEWFLYGKARYEECRKKLIACVEDSSGHCKTPSMLYEYLDRVESMKKRTIPKGHV
jgi:hypothetical protein